MFGFLMRKTRRHIFGFQLDGRTVYRDPVEVRRKLSEANPKWAELVDLVVKASKPLPGKMAAAAGDLAKERAKQAEDAAKELADLVSVAFDVPALSGDGRGMTRAERIGLMASYIGWCAEVMRAARPKASSPAAMVSSPAGV